MVMDENKTILVFGAMDVPEERKIGETLGSTKIPLQAIKANMEAVLGDVIEVFNDVKEKVGKCKVEYIDLNIGISVDGSIGIFGTGVGAEAKGGMTIRIKIE